MSTSITNKKNKKKEEANEDTLKINEEFKEKFHYLKKRQALEKTKLKYGKNFEDKVEESEESSDDESEDSEGDLINEKIMGKFIETYIKLKDDKMSREFLKDDKPIFKDEDFISANKKVKLHEKPQYTVNDALLNFNDNQEDIETDNNGNNIYSLDYQTKMNIEEDEEKKKFMEKANEEETSNKSENNEEDFVDDGFLKKKAHSSIIVVNDTKDNKDNKLEKEEEIEFENLPLNTVLDKAKIRPEGLDIQLLKNIWGDDKKLDKNERFLRNYILSEAWLENEENKINKHLLLIDKEDEEKDEQFDDYEFKYNHRFEEAGGANITTYQRNIEQSYRLKDDSRAQKRKQRELRKKEETAKMVSELKIAKDFKKEEAKKKIELIEKVAGTGKINELLDELENDFDPDKFDQKMNTIFNEEYYGVMDKEEDIKQVIEEKSFDYKTNKSIPDRKQLKQLEKLENEELYQTGEENEQYIDENEGENYDEGEDENNPLWFYCDNCKNMIKENKIKYECNNCDDYVLCKDCFKSYPHNHKMKKSKVPLGCKPPNNWKEILENLKNDEIENLLICTNCNNEIAINYYFICNEEQCNHIKICKACRGIGKSVHPDHKLTKFFIENEEEEKEVLNPKEKLNSLIETVYDTAVDKIIANEIPTKFRYTRVESDDVGLSDEMLLYLDDKTLNKYVPLKRLAPYKEKFFMNDWQKKKMIRDLTKEVERNKAEVLRINQQTEENVKHNTKFLASKRKNNKKQDDQGQDFKKKKRLETYGIQS